MERGKNCNFEGAANMQALLPVLQSNLIGILLMLITLFSLPKNLRSGVLADRRFFMLVLSVMVVCFLEIMSSVFEYRTFPGARDLNRLSNALLFAANPFPAFLWALYAHSKVYQNEDRLKRSVKILLIPLVLVVILSVANLFADVFFSISPQNEYVRARFFAVSTLLSVVYMLYVAVIVLLERKNIERALPAPMLSFMVLPVVGLLLQFLFYGLYMLWVSVSISVIIVFNHVQNDASITDWLTGLYNRKHLDNYLHQMCKRKHRGILAGLMVDIDCFKSINDTYGHLVGDRALQSIAILLKKNAGPKAYVARYAGDEFVIVGEFDQEEQILHTIQSLRKAVYDFNQTGDSPYRLSLSIGYAVFKGRDRETEDAFLSRIDSAMYLVKSKDSSQSSSEIRR